MCKEKEMFATEYEIKVKVYTRKRTSNEMKKRDAGQLNWHEKFLLILISVNLLTINHHILQLEPESNQIIP